MNFHNREQELKMLAAFQKRAQTSPQMTVILGRRRMGKTTLIREFLRSVSRSFYFFVTRKRSSDLLDEFTDQLASEVPALRSARLTWDGFIGGLFSLAEARPVTIIFDEFQNFTYVEPSVFSIIQKHWDTKDAQGRMHLVTIGSLITSMEKIFKGSKEPLFRRASNYLLVKPFSSTSVEEVLPAAEPTPRFKRLVEFYTVFGGCPKYYALAEDYGLLREDPFKVIRELILEENAPLRDEGKALLIEEFGREHATYFSILRAIAAGKVQTGEIADATGIAVTTLPKDLRRLEEVFGLIARYEPILQKSHKITRYRIVDPFLTFWFRYVFPFQSQLELGRTKTVLDYIRKDLGVIEGKVFEAIARERIALSDRDFKIPFEPDLIGSWWTRKHDEIDVVAVNKKERTAFLAECKLSATKVDRGVIHDLVRKASLFDSIFPLSNRHLAIFTIGRVAKEIRAEAQRADVEIREL